MLLTQNCVVSEDATRERAYMRYIKKNFKSWLHFAEEQDYNIGLGDLILVTGHDTTHDYAMAAYASNSTSLRIAFQAGMPGTASASVSVWGTWQTSPFVYHNCGPVSAIVASSDSASVTLPLDETPLEDILGNDIRVTSSDSGVRIEAGSLEHYFSQCIFLRGYRMRERRPLAPSVIAAAAIGANRPGSPRDATERPAPLLVHGPASAGDSDNVSFYSDTTPVRAIP